MPMTLVAQLVIGERFGAGAERRAFHVHVSAAVMGRRTAGACGFQQNFAQLLADRVGERDVRHDAAPEKCVLKIALGAVEELVNDHDVARLVFLPATNRRR
jgi:hypothetical protein